MKKGKFIVIEGIDASGKSTQTTLLKNYLKKKGYKIATADFPRYYESPWGKLVGRFMAGEFGQLDEISPYFAVLPYMVDQYTWSRDIGTKLINQGKVIITNRYFTSNVHQVAKMKGSSQTKYRKWLWPIGYKNLGIMRPDLVIFLDAPPKVTKNLNLKKSARKYLKGKKEDIAEAHRKHQRQAYKEYKRMVKYESWWKSVPCMTNGKLDKPEVIHKRVLQIVKRYIQ